MYIHELLYGNVSYSNRSNISAEKINFPPVVSMILIVAMYSRSKHWRCMPISFNTLIYLTHKSIGLRVSLITEEQKGLIVSRMHFLRFERRGNPMQCI